MLFEFPDKFCFVTCFRMILLQKLKTPQRFKVKRDFLRTLYTYLLLKQSLARVSLIIIN